MSVEKKLCKLHHKAYACLVGNATAGIILTLKALGLVNAKIALPNSICPNVPLAVLFSGNKPLFLDITDKDLGLSIDAMEENKDEIDAVLANHSYGMVCNISVIREFCNVNQIPLIEDFAVAQGATAPGGPVGSFGDISIVSFGVGKIVGIEQGGAVLSDNKSLIDEIERISGGYPELSNKQKEHIILLGTSFRKNYNKYYGTETWGKKQNIWNIARSHGEMFYYKFPQLKRGDLMDNLNKLDLNISDRQKKADVLNEKISSINNEVIKIVQPPSGSVYWRYNILVAKKRNELLKYLLHKGFLVSSWYPSMNVLFSDGKTETPFSDYISDTILNLWVNWEVNSDYLHNIATEIEQFFSKR